MAARSTTFGEDAAPIHLVPRVGYAWIAEYATAQRCKELSSVGCKNLHTSLMEICFWALTTSTSVSFAALAHPRGLSDQRK
jgi:hypothetical protein